jgi:hypothetical protein
MKWLLSLTNKTTNFQDKKRKRYCFEKILFINFLEQYCKFDKIQRKLTILIIMRMQFYI